MERESINMECEPLKKVTLTEQIMEQIAKECRIGLVAYTITHHTRQSAVGLPFIQKKSTVGKRYL